VYDVHVTSDLSIPSAAIASGLSNTPPSMTYTDQVQRLAPVFYSITTRRP
jgi:hypothetical protein